MVGELTVEHHMPPINWVQQRVLGVVPPAGERVRTVVRHFYDPEHAGKLRWRRTFYHGGCSFETEWTMDSASEPVSEAFGPIGLDQTLELAAPASASAEGLAEQAVLRHHATWLFGWIPLPLLPLHSHAVMDVIDDDSYHLTVHVTMFRMPMLTATTARTRYAG